MHRRQLQIRNHVQTTRVAQVRGCFHVCLKTGEVQGGVPVVVDLVDAQLFGQLQVLQRVETAARGCVVDARST